MNKWSHLVSGDAYSDIREGDCIVAFSRKHIFAIKQKVESATGYQCAVVYGGLPSGESSLVLINQGTVACFNIRM